MLSKNVSKETDPIKFLSNFYERFCASEGKNRALEERVQELEKQTDYVPDERQTRKDLSEMYKLSYPTIHALMKQGLPYEKVGRKTLFRRQEVDNFFKQQNRK